MNHRIRWQRLDFPGYEDASLQRVAEDWVLAGCAAFRREEKACRIHYRVDCGPDWHTRRVEVYGFEGERGFRHRIQVEDGHWFFDGEPQPQLRGCVDIDLGFSPSTNLLPIRRLGLAVGASAAVDAAWLAFPALKLSVLPQVYTRLASNRYRYSSRDGAFVAELTVDGEGLVTDYPGLWRASAA